MPDPLIEAAAGGAAKGVVKIIAERGADWLIQLAAGQSATVRAKMRANADAFMESLSKHLQQVEVELTEVQREVFGEALE